MSISKHGEREIAFNKGGCPQKLRCVSKFRLMLLKVKTTQLKNPPLPSLQSTDSSQLFLQGEETKWTFSL